jgi:MATE family multidrug resistance protein
MSSTLFVLVIASPINVLLTYLLVYPAGLGFVGAPIATSVTYFLLPLLTILYMNLFGGLECWYGWDRNSMFKGWYEFLKLGLAGIVMMCSEWWAFEVCALVAGLLGETVLAAQTIVLQTSSLFYMVPLG